jgi:hypothetical protein
MVDNSSTHIMIEFRGRCQGREEDELRLETYYVFLVFIISINNQNLKEPSRLRFFALKLRCERAAHSTSHLTHLST